MAIAVPQPGNDVSAELFGKPVADAVNALQLGTARMGGTWRRAANQAIPTAVGTTISWDTEDDDTNAFAVVPFTTLTIPAGCGGVYAVNGVAWTGSGSSGVVRLVASTYPNPFSAPTNPFDAWASVGFVGLLPAGSTISFAVQQGGGTTIQTTGKLSLYRIAA